MSEKYTQGSVLGPVHYGMLMLGLPCNYKLIQDLRSSNALTCPGSNYWLDPGKSSEHDLVLWLHR